jgi:hypothetical protein
MLGFMDGGFATGNINFSHEIVTDDSQTIKK